QALSPPSSATGGGASAPASSRPPSKWARLETLMSAGPGALAVETVALVDAAAVLAAASRVPVSGCGAAAGWAPEGLKTTRPAVIGFAVAVAGGAWTSTAPVGGWPFGAAPA